MRLIVAKSSGFCFGVKKAIELAKDSIHKYNTIYTLGPIIHNPQVVKRLEEEGIKSVDSIEKIASQSDTTLIIRSHGTTPQVIDKITKMNLNMIDATCPYVKRVHKTVKEFSDKGYNIIIVGQRCHPEIVGVNGWCNNKAFIINSMEEARELPDMNNICVVAQTTLDKNEWHEIVKILKTKYKDKNIVIHNTICSNTFPRQQEAREISKIVTKMYVIGGKNSANTRKLYEICKENCNETYLIETYRDIDFSKIDKHDVIGITAGASTPDWIIKEVIGKMQENFDANVDDINFQESLEKNFVELHTGDILTGTVIKVSQEEVVVNLGYKSDGIVSKQEFSNENIEDLREVVKEGDQIEVEVIKVNDGEGNVLLSKKTIDEKRSWDKIEQAHKDNSTINITIKEKVKGGLIGYYDVLRVFVPASQVSNKYVEDLNQFINTNFDVKIIECSKRQNKIVASRRDVLNEQLEEQQKKLWDSIKEGDRIKGTVKNITDFGVFVDIGGVDGLIHISDLSWGKIKDPHEILKTGDVVEVMILSLDPENEKISLGLKQTMPHPWDNIKDKYKEGQVVKGKIVKITGFGAFVELEPGVDGLIHISQISNERINKISDVLKVGQEVEAKILEIKPEDRRISLSIKELLPKKEKSNSEPVGEKEQKTKFVKEEMKVTIGELFKDASNNIDIINEKIIKKANEDE
ncbi:MAG TPA: bifunctional 4-hydroxy-3-methylbut-2-enyl diphosphate reductase/30S ribosomal protein S1 [Clostridiales bacterium]|nr:bifunctional 4-hydroxy-3-methylbut-2-enyl diphosphate reductase/30S ribosomal protein S1 [Clostridiales bacterium]